MIGKRIIIAALLAPWLFALTATMGPARSADGRADGGADGTFLAGAADLPLMPGLRELPEMAMVFDKPDGRLVRAMAVGETEQTALWRFYDETLPQLGWRRLGPGNFIRDGERLHITAKKSDGALIVRFAIAPGTE